ncbi:MAG: hypothetical protein IJ424_06215 [Oscillospiraceae bacterium]|nr:hypothetical protein [Oscillospiraceae bacterium]
MKKVISLLTALMLCLTMACSVYAVEDPFVPSINYRNDALLVSIKDDAGNVASGLLRDADGNIIAYVYDSCLSITSIAEALDFRYAMPEDIREELVDVYNELNDETVKLPYDELDTDLRPADIAIRELIDATLACDDHAAELKKEGVVIELIFDLGIDKDASVFAFTYIEGEWGTIVNVVNNGDGTVTCTFEDLCPIALCVAEQQPEVPSWVARIWETLSNWLARFFR